MFTASKYESAQYPSGPSAERKNRRQQVGRVVAFLFVIGISVGIMLGRSQIEHLAAYGYPAVFLVSLLGNATVVLPAPSFAFVFAAGTALDPIVVGLAAGLGAAIGEMTGYLAGIGGQGVIEDRPLFRRIERWMEKSGTLVIFLLGAVPNPFFDVGGMIAGAVRMPVWRFLLAGWLGKSIRFSVVALTATLLM
jgi:membrane protein YqaA with SNARE-associated domain